MPIVTSPGSVLQKKLRPRKPERGRAHMALERRADDLFRRTMKDTMGLDLVVSKVSVAPMQRDAAFEQIPQIAAWYVLTNGGEALGFAALDGTALDALIEFETLGRVTSASRGDRAVTRIDARIGQRLVDQTLNSLAQMIPSNPELGFERAFRIARQEWDRPTLDLALDLPAYSVMLAELDFGPGGKTGQVQFWFPGSNHPTSQATGPAQQNPEMHFALADVETRLDTRVKGVRVPLSMLTTLTVGSEIRLPADCLTRVVILEPSGREVLSARLGQLNGSRALRITGPARGRAKLDTAAPPMMEGLDLLPGGADAGLASAPAELAAPEMPLADIGLDTAVGDLAAGDLPMADMAADALGGQAEPMGGEQSAPDMAVMSQPMGLESSEEDPLAGGFAAAPMSID